jgi:undecaprenyl-diphosphatase
MWKTLKHWDREIFVYLNGLGIDRFDGFWIFVTRIDTWIPLFILFFILIFYYYKRISGLVVFAFLLLTVAVTLGITDVVKDYEARLRPNNVEALSQLIRILQKPTNYSFFSGHASSSFAITTFMVLALRKYTKWIYISYLWPILFVMSRIFVGVHYPSDIFVGAIVGTLLAFFFFYFCKKNA